MAGRRRTGALALLLAAVGWATASCAWPGGGPDTPGSHPAPRNTASDRIGALFLGSADGPRMCTASVVSSPRHNLLVTAAHCVETLDRGREEGLVFAPGLRDGRTPYGVWPLTGITVDEHWTDSEDPEYDVAFLTVADVDGQEIEDVLGGNRLGTGRGFGLPVSVTGYPNDSEEPITCATRTASQSPTQESFRCTGYSVGTSGSPWLTADGAVIGVIGGYQQGGYEDEVSYSVTFDDRVSALYRRATA
ncbi:MULTISPECIES: trypsin-like peptidase domain-containing protein [Kitasatospora]|uniref:Trypsin-like peptidase domain-containing protein n=1 Tax=Kitasatospora arboriphila TaxID=258052 RepID=A0ABN1TDR3_9ACTN